MQRLDFDISDEFDMNDYNNREKSFRDFQDDYRRPSQPQPLPPHVIQVTNQSDDTNTIRNMDYVISQAAHSNPIKNRNFIAKNFTSITCICILIALFLGKHKKLK